METIWLGVLQQLITTLSGVAFIGLSTIAGIYVKKLTTSLQRKNLEKEISQYVHAAEQSPSFKGYSGEQKYDVVLARAKTWAKDNSVLLTDDELMILIESSVKDMKLAGPILRAKLEEKDEEGVLVLPEIENEALILVTSGSREIHEEAVG